MLTASGELGTFLAKHKDALPELFIVSQVELAKEASPKAQRAMEGLSAEVLAASGNRCPRCWTYAAEVGAQTLCNRCVEAMG